MSLKRLASAALLMVFSSVSVAQLVHFGYWRNLDAEVDCYNGSPVSGDRCQGGAQYLGEFNWVDGSVTGTTSKYMILPGGCNGTTDNPSCVGMDGNAVQMSWNTSSTSYVDTVLPNVGVVGLKDAMDGRQSTSSLVGTDSDDVTIGFQHHLAAKYCADMKYGGYEDWYLPTKTELAYFYCKAKPTGTHSVSLPPEDSNCANYGGKQNVNFMVTSAGDGYWSSTESTKTNAYRQSFINGNQVSTAKASVFKVRCVRRMNEPVLALSVGGSTSFVKGLLVQGLDFDYNNQPSNPVVTLNVKNIGDTDASGVDVVLPSGFAVVGGTCASGTALLKDQVCTLQIQAVASGRLDNTLFSGQLQVAPGAYASAVVFLEGMSTNIPDPCAEPDPEVGIRCQGGSTYMGKLNWQEGKVADGVYTASQYMVMPSGCDGTTLNPVCDGSTDSAAVSKAWNDENNSGYVDTPRANIASATTPDLNDGRLLTVALVSEDSDYSEAGLQPHRAAKYCYDMVFGGYEDWYLPTNTEMAYMYCKAVPSSHNVSYPTLDPNCTGRFGGKESILTGFELSQHYWTATESELQRAWFQNFGTGYSHGGTSNGLTPKYSKNRVRCVRRMNTPYFVAASSMFAFSKRFSLTGLDVNYSDPSAAPTQELIIKNTGDVSAAGVNLVVSGGFAIVGGTCSALLPLAKNQTCTVELQGVTSERWLNGTHSGTLQVVDGSGISIFTLQGASTNFPDPCSREGTPIGTVCSGGALFMGKYNWQEGGTVDGSFAASRYMVMPAGCSGSTADPVCTGGLTVDGNAVRFAWNSGNTNYIDTMLPNIATADTADRADGKAWTEALAAEDSDSVTADTQPHNAAKYCADMVYGGYSDWYLPTKSEAAFLYCKSGQATGHNTSYPNEAVNCTAYGGKQYFLYGFNQSAYWTLSELAEGTAYRLAFNSGQQSTISKNVLNYVRCIRRY